MKKIELSSSQFTFILEKLPDIKERLCQKNTSIQVSLKDDELELLLNKLSDLFSEIGLKTDSEPNEIGYFIENIIDNLSRIFYQNYTPETTPPTSPPKRK